MHMSHIAVISCVIQSIHKRPRAFCCVYGLEELGINLSIYKVLQGARYEHRIIHLKLAHSRHHYCWTYIVASIY